MARGSPPNQTWSTTAASRSADSATRNARPLRAASVALVTMSESFTSRTLRLWADTLPELPHRDGRRRGDVEGVNSTLHGDHDGGVRVHECGLSQPVALSPHDDRYAF